MSHFLNNYKVIRGSAWNTQAFSGEDITLAHRSCFLVGFIEGSVHNYIGLRIIMKSR